jgi:hydroxybutyrate-dimer hydrolase
MHPEDRPLRRSARGAAALAVLALAAGCNSSHMPSENQKPDFVVGPYHTYYDGINDDLLTAGLGSAGLGYINPPVLAVPPTLAQLRRLAIYTNYHALVDTTTAGGYGSLYGPNVAPDGTVTTGNGMVSGTEYTAYDDDGSGLNVTMVVQIPDTFSVQSPCIVAATSSGSRGVYGAISTAEWGLKRGCAVALTDKGTGAGGHDLQADTVPLIDGTRATSAAAAAASGASAPSFNAGLSASELAAFNAATPNRFAFKHAHSGRNPEKDWGTYTLHAIKFALWALNDARGNVNFDGTRSIVVTPQNTIIIAASASNGGGAAIAAAELDTEGLIDGVAVSEPNIEMPASANVTVQRGSTAVATTSKSLYDYASYANLYQSCASLSAQVAGAPGYLSGVLSTNAANRCTSLHAKGLLAATTLAAQADEALQKLRDYGWEPESAVLYASLAAFEVAPAVTVTYANAYARAKVSDNLCGYSFAATDATSNAVVALDAASLEKMWSIGSGIPPTGNVQLVNNRNPGGALRDLFSQSPTTLVADFNLDGAQCLRNLLAGTDPVSKALQAGIDETRRTGKLNGKPVIIVHGRADALLPVNHTSRPYAALEHSVDGGSSQLSYVEVANAQHFDTFISQPAGVAGYDSRFVPLHLYLNRALDAMYAHLKNGTPLPPSQVVRTIPRGGTAGTAPAIAASNVPAIASAPATGDAITFHGSTIVVPD